MGSHDGHLAINMQSGIEGSGIVINAINIYTNYWVMQYPNRALLAVRKPPHPDTRQFFK